MAAQYVQVPILSYDSSKAEETAALGKMRQAAGEGTFLSRILSNELVDWAANQIANDFSCDIYSAYQSEVANKRRLSEECDQLSRRVGVKESELTEQTATAARKLEILESVNAGQREVCESLTQRLDEVTRTAANTQARYNFLVDALSQVVKDAWFTGQTITPEALRSLLATYDTAEPLEKSVQ